MSSGLPLVALSFGDGGTRESQPLCRVESKGRTSPLFPTIHLKLVRGHVRGGRTHQNVLANERRQSCMPIDSSQILDPLFQHSSVGGLFQQDIQKTLIHRALRGMLLPKLQWSLTCGAVDFLVVAVEKRAEALIKFRQRE